MNNVISTWNGLDLRRRLVVIGATIAVFLAVLALARLGPNPQMALLYAGLDNRAAGEMMTALDQRAAPYEIRGDSIWVQAKDRDALRMSLAGEGLPAAGGAGYELLDSLSGFGTTSEMFDVAYWRAKEGELARTILAIPSVRNARVHISQGPTDAFRRQAKPTASVTVTTASGNLAEDAATALKHLVASAVAGMQADDVQVIDTVRGLIAASSPEDSIAGSAAAKRAEEIRHRVERLLAARVGQGKAVVEVSVDLNTEREQITERRFDPQGRVAISSETEERSQQTTDPGGDVTVASNLPDGDAAANGGSGQSQTTETRERTNFEVSETQRELMRAPGGIRRMSVAVLVDGQMQPGADGTAVWSARSEAELSALRELVASAVGLDEERGDVLTLKSLEFQPLIQGGTEAGVAALPLMQSFDMMQIIQIGALALVALILGLFVLRPILLPGRREALPSPGAPLALPGIAGMGAGTGMGFGGDALTGEIDEGGFTLPDLPMVDFSAIADDTPIEDPAERLRRLINERQEESLEILRSWLDPEEERV